MNGASLRDARVGRGLAPGGVKRDDVRPRDAVARAM
jgi:hypothetical protein